jgi:hypothetical protein
MTRSSSSGRTSSTLSPRRSTLIPCRARRFRWVKAAYVVLRYYTLIFTLCAATFCLPSSHAESDSPTASTPLHGTRAYAVHSTYADRIACDGTPWNSRRYRSSSGCSSSLWRREVRLECYSGRSSGSCIFRQYTLSIDALAKSYGRWSSHGWSSTSLSSSAPS